MEPGHVPEKRIHNLVSSFTACACRMLCLLEQNMPTKRFKRFSREVYLNRDTVHTLHRIFNVEVTLSSCPLIVRHCALDQPCCSRCKAWQHSACAARAARLDGLALWIAEDL